MLKANASLSVYGVLYARVSGDSGVWMASEGEGEEGAGREGREAGGGSAASGGALSLSRGACSLRASCAEG